MLTQPRIVLFTTPTCTYCKTAKRYFQEQKLRFKEIDITRDRAGMKDMQRRTNGNTGVPVILINNRPVIGFDKNKINRLLNIN